MIRVTNRQRWNRTKGVTVALLLVGAIASVGGMEDADATRPANFPLAWGLVIVAGLITAGIIRRPQ